MKKFARSDVHPRPRNRFNVLELRIALKMAGSAPMCVGALFSSINGSTNAVSEQSHKAHRYGSVEIVMRAT